MDFHSLKIYSGAVSSIKRSAYVPSFKAFFDGVFYCFLWEVADLLYAHWILTSLFCYLITLNMNFHTWTTNGTSAVSSRVLSTVLCFVSDVWIYSYVTKQQISTFLTKAFHVDEYYDICWQGHFTWLCRNKIALKLLKSCFAARM